MIGFVETFGFVTLSVLPARVTLDTKGARSPF
jgi:hypothetical protein